MADATRNYLAPTGSRIIGTAERIPGVALIVGITDAGEPEHAGETDVDWDGQVTLTRGGKTLFVDEDGQQWTFDQLVVDDGDDEAEG